MDLEFMTGRPVTFYWRFCWIFLSPVAMTTVFIYSTITMKPLQYAGMNYPIEYLVAGWCIFLIGMIQLPLWACWTFARNSKHSFLNAICESFRPTKYWGPHDKQIRIEWLKYKEEAKQRHRMAAQAANHSAWKQKLYIIFGKY